MTLRDDAHIVLDATLGIDPTDTTLPALYLNAARRMAVAVLNADIPGRGDELERLRAALAVDRDRLMQQSAELAAVRAELAELKRN